MLLPFWWKEKIAWLFWGEKKPSHLILMWPSISIFYAVYFLDKSSKWSSRYWRFITQTKCQAFLCLYGPDYAAFCFTCLEFFTYIQYLWKLWLFWYASILLYILNAFFLAAENFSKKGPHRIKQDFSKWGLGTPEDFR